MEKHTFQSWGDWVRACQRPKDASVLRASSRDNRASEDWDANAGWNKALTMASMGWSEGVKQFNFAAQAITTAVAETVALRTFRPDDTEGLFYDANALIAGDPDYWFKQEPALVEGESVTIVMNAVASAMVSAEILTIRGAAVAALAEVLELDGRGVEVWLAYGVNATERVQTMIRVKSMQERVGPSILSYALAHPAAFRRLYFAFQESRPDAARRFNVGGGYGSPCEIEAKDMPDGALYVPMAMGGEPQWRDRASAEQWVREQLKRQGVEVFE